jgi:hypothetical protein
MCLSGSGTCSLRFVALQEQRPRVTLLLGALLLAMLAYVSLRVAIPSGLLTDTNHSTCADLRKLNVALSDLMSDEGLSDEARNKLSAFKSTIEELEFTRSNGVQQNHKSANVPSRLSGTFGYADESSQSGGVSLQHPEVSIHSSRSQTPTQVLFPASSGMEAPSVLPAPSFVVDQSGLSPMTQSPPSFLQPLSASLSSHPECLPPSMIDWLLPSACCDPSTPLFVDVAKRHVTDKVRTPGVDRTHNYDPLYQQYVSPLRCNNVTFLEIGLGCGMAYHEGHSLTLWMEYLPRAAIVEVEANWGCVTVLRQNWEAAPATWVNTSATSWADAFKRVSLEIGDQTDASSLRLVGEARGPFDIVVDDGGHTMLQQVTSLAALWPYVRPGGVYIVEDLQCAYLGLQHFMDHPISMVQYIAKLQEALHDSRRKDGLDPKHYISFNAVLSTLASVHCFPEACVLIKSATGIAPA